MCCGELQNGLAARGVEVVRLNTYTTRQVSTLNPIALQAARQARVLSIASPSAIKCAPPPGSSSWTSQMQSSFVILLERQ